MKSDMTQEENKRHARYVRDEMVAAITYVGLMIGKAYIFLAREDRVPFWHGWALREAFLAGVQMETVELAKYRSVVFFTGAGMSAESGVPVYLGRGGIWRQYNYEDYACQRAFDRDPQKVLDFHEVRRTHVLACEPHAGHRHIARLQQVHPDVHVITQNTDGMFQRAGVRVDAELHGSLWRMRCERHGVREDLGGGTYATRTCEECGATLRPDIVWFEDMVNPVPFETAHKVIRNCDLFIAVGTSAVVYPAAGLPHIARNAGATMIEVNPEETEMSSLYQRQTRAPASVAIPALLPL
jgi:NAD-dependent deacetylase